MQSSGTQTTHRIIVSYIHRSRGAVMRSLNGRVQALKFLETLVDKIASGEVESVCNAESVWNRG